MPALRAWADDMVATQRALGCVGGCPVGSLAAQLADTSEDARLDLVDSFQEWESYVINGLRSMQTSGDLDAQADPNALGVAVMAAVQGGLLLTKTTRDTRPLELALDMALAFVASHCADDGLSAPHTRTGLQASVEPEVGGLQGFP